MTREELVAASIFWAKIRYYAIIVAAVMLVVSTWTKSVAASWGLALAWAVASYAAFRVARALKALKQESDLAHLQCVLFAALAIMNIFL